VNAVASKPATMLPTPARIGTAASSIASPRSGKSQRSWMAGIRVISEAKAKPWQQKAVLTAPG
jgi:hypothetical protein